MPVSLPKFPFHLALKLVPRALSFAPWSSSFRPHKNGSEMKFGAHRLWVNLYKWNRFPKGSVPSYLIKVKSDRYLLKATTYQNRITRSYQPWSLGFKQKLIVCLFVGLCYHINTSPRCLIEILYCSERHRKWKRLWWDNLVVCGLQCDVSDVYKDATAGWHAFSCTLYRTEHLNLFKGTSTQTRLKMCGSITKVPDDNVIVLFALCLWERWMASHKHTLTLGFAGTFLLEGT